MKKVLICCTNAVATSTFVATKVKKRMAAENIPVTTKTCSILEIDRQIKSFNPDVIISNVGKAAKINANVPVVDGISILSGKNDEESWTQVINILKGE
jgi:galactitol PTS system EIIB component